MKIADPRYINNSLSNPPVPPLTFEFNNSIVTVGVTDVHISADLKPYEITYGGHTMVMPGGMPGEIIEIKGNVLGVAEMTEEERTRREAVRAISDVAFGPPGTPTKKQMREAELRKSIPDWLADPDFVMPD